jgi:hypothetical protein
MRVFHEGTPNQLESILTNGLKKESRGDKGSDTWIIKTDAYLDARRPKYLIEDGVSRDDNIYAYYPTGSSVIDIVDGAPIPIDAFIRAKKGSLLELTVDPRRCYVSDLDTYDAIKAAFSQHESPGTLEQLARSYWNKIIRLDTYQSSALRRPEIMITYDLDPRDIKRAH